MACNLTEFAMVPPPDMPAPLDAIGRYTIERPLGAGAMGNVYLAYDTRLRRRVALKILGSRVQSMGVDAIAAAMREARAAGAITHPNAAAVFDADDANGVAYIVMEYVPGTPLRRFVGDPSVSIPVRVRWIVDIAGALAAAHAVGVVHRDVKPENVLIRDDGLVKVLDFGIARTVDGTDEGLGGAAGTHVTWTQDGGFVGTPGYMAPETLRGQQADARADQFAWGVLAYELLAGQLPWKRADTAFGMIASVLTQRPDPLGPDVPPAVASVVMRALSKVPEDRFPSLAHAAFLIADFADTAALRMPTEPIVRAPPPSPRADPPPPSTPAAPSAPREAWGTLSSGTAPETAIPSSPRSAAPSRAAPTMGGEPAAPSARRTPIFPQRDASAPSTSRAPTAPTRPVIDPRVEQTGDKPAPRFGDNPFDKPAPRFGDNPFDKPAPRFGDNPVDKPTPRFGDNPVDKPAPRFGDNPFDKPAPRFGDETPAPPATRSTPAFPPRRAFDDAPPPPPRRKLDSIHEEAPPPPRRKLDSIHEEAPPSPRIHPRLRLDSRAEPQPGALRAPEPARHTPVIPPRRAFEDPPPSSSFAAGEPPRPAPRRAFDSNHDEAPRFRVDSRVDPIGDKPPSRVADSTADRPAPTQRFTPVIPPRRAFESRPDEGPPSPITGRPARGRLDSVPEDTPPRRKLDSSPDDAPLSPTVPSRRRLDGPPTQASPRRAPDIGFRAPDFNAPVDVQAHIALLPPDATCKGMFFNDLLALAGRMHTPIELAFLAGIPERRYTSFRDYPMKDNMRLTVAVAATVYPRVPLGEALRRMGQRTLGLVLDSHIGRTLFSVLPRDPVLYLTHGPKAYRALFGFGEVTTEKVSPTSIRAHVRDMPLFLETYQIGVLESVLDHCNARARIEISMVSLSEATVSIRLL